MSVAMSLVVPAHDEAGLVGSMLSRIVDGDPAEQIEIVVVANGCSDTTAAVARAAAPRAKVVEIATGSKPAALNEGDEHATTYPRAYVDADVSITASTLLALARRLDGDPARGVAAPTMIVDSRGSSRWIRSFYRVWEHTSFRRLGHVGSGVYMLSRAGRERFARFPDVVADDRFVQVQFAPDERLTAHDLTFTVAAPKTLRAHVRRATRIQAGNRELEQFGLVRFPDDLGSSTTALVGRVLRRPGLWLDFPVYVVGYAVARAAGAWRLRTATVTWGADRTTR
jgi:glycosyltransferase involved in cell wall biosynthesis